MTSISKATQVRVHGGEAAARAGRRFVGAACAVVLALSAPAAFWLRPAQAAGAVEMQVERIVSGAINEYNQAMEAGDPEPWLKYFTDNARRQSPTSSQSGRAQFDEYYKSEFKDWKAKITPKKTVVMARTIAVLFDWEAVPRASPTDTPVKLEMAAFFDMSSSGRFDAVAYVFDPAKFGKPGGAAK
jgi:hypothetical protein